MMKRLPIVAVFCLLPTLACAQVKLNIPYHVSAQHDGQFTDSYKLYIDGTVVATLPITALVNGSLEFSAPALTTLGNHTCVVGAVGVIEVMSDTLTFTVERPDPKKPTNLIIKVVVP